MLTMPTWERNHPSRLVGGGVEEVQMLVDLDLDLQEAEVQVQVRWNWIQF